MSNRPRFILALLILSLPPVLAAQPRQPSPKATRSPAAVYAEGRAALQEGRAQAAESLFRQAVAADPTRLEYHIALAESLVAQKRLAEAEATLLAVRPARRGSPQLEILLAQIRLWQGRLGEAASGFEAVLSDDPANLTAREGLATALYWSGDWPGAAAQYRELLARRPDDETTRVMLAEIEQISAARAEAVVTYAEDDQPYRRSRAYLSFSPATRSLTRWRVDAGSYLLEAVGSGVSESAPFATLHVERSFPRSRFSAEAWARAQGFPDGEARILGGAVVRRALTAASRLSLAVEQRELLYTTTSLTNHPFVTAATLRWDLEQNNGWYAAAYGEALRYFDDNSGVAAGVYAAAPVLRRRALTLWIGAGASFRDTDETRYRLESIASAPAPGGGFTYLYRGVYDPYWTPVRTSEARGAMVLRWTGAQGTAVRIQADGGVAEEQVVGFGPDHGNTPFVVPGSGVFERRIHPWRAGVELTQPIGRSNRLTIGYEHFVTAFYVSDEVVVRLSRTFR